MYLQKVKNMGNKSPSSSNAKINVITFAIMNMVAVISLRGLPAEAEYGLGSIFFYLFAALFFLIPVSLVAAELATAWPEKGGIFRWVGEAFGPKLAFLAMFLLFVQVCIWFPTAITFGAVSLAFITPDQTFDTALSQNKYFVLIIVLSIYWFATYVAFHGVSAFTTLSKWGGIIGAIIPSILLIIIGFAFFLDGGNIQIEMKFDDLFPDLTKFSNLVLAANIFLFYAGMEMNAIHVKELHNPTRSYPLAISFAAIGIVITYIFGTLAIAFIVPKSEINITQSLLVTFFDLFKWAGIGFLGPIIAICLAIGVLAAVVTWVAGPSTGLLEVAKAGYLPQFWQKTNAKGMATNILLGQSIIVSILASIFVVLPSVEAAYQILSQLAAVTYLIIYILMFLSAIRLRLHQPDRPRPYQLPGGKYGLYLFASIGLSSATVALLFSFIPPSQISVGSPILFVSILMGLAIIFITIPFLIYSFKKPSWRNENSDFAAFTWQVNTKKISTEQDLNIKDNNF